MSLLATNSHGLSKKLALIWLILFAALLLSALHYLPSLKPDTNVLNLLPEERRHPLIDKAQQQINKEWQHTVVWLAKGEDKAGAVKAAQDLSKALEASQLFSRITITIKPEQGGSLYRELADYRFQLLTAADQSAIENDAQSFMQQRLQLLYTPVGMQYAMSLQLDPFFTFGSYNNQLFGSQAIDLQDDVVIFEDGTAAWALIVSQVKEAGFSQQKTLAQLHQDLTGDNIIAAGMPLYSAYGAESAEKEMSTVGTVSIVAIVAFMLLGFRSLSPLLLTLLSITTGVATAVVACLAVFGKLHIITLVFGSSLISITVDYSFHYFCDRLRKDCGSAIESLKTVLPGICLGVGSSVIAYGILWFTPFPALQQMGLFSVSGLLAAWLTVVLLFPLITEKMSLPDKVPAPFLYQWYLSAWPQWVRQYRFLALGFAALFVAVGVLKLDSQDDIRAMQEPAANVSWQEKKVMELGRQRLDGQYFIVSAENSDALLLAEKALLDRLDKVKAQGTIKAYQAISQILPDAKTQNENWQLLERELFASKIYQNAMQSLSMQQSVIDQIEQDFYAAKNRIVTSEQWLTNANVQWQSLWLGCNEAVCSSVVRLEGIKDSQALIALSSLADSPSILFVDTVGDINHMLEKYRHIASGFLLIALLLIGVFLVLFLGVKKAFLIISVPLVAQLLALASLSVLGHAISMFHVFGLLLALGISMDYSIFQTVGKHHETVAMAVLLSLLTSLLAFGLLASSSTAFIQAFGLSLGLGIFFAYMLAPLFTYQSNKGL